MSLYQQTNSYLLFPLLPHLITTQQKISSIINTQVTFIWISGHLDSLENDNAAAKKFYRGKYRRAWNFTFCVEVGVEKRDIF